jgi:hypothetical protein
VWAIAFGTATGTQILTTPNNSRVVNVFGGQLYGSSGSSPYTGVFTIGTGLPSTAGQAATLLPGVSASAPYGFAMFDRNPAVTGIDTLYLAVDSSTGVQRWDFDGTTWTSTTLLATAVRGLAALVTGTTVTLLATQSSPNKVIRLVDDGSGLLTPTDVVTAPANTAYRGIAFSAR